MALSTPNGLYTDGGISVRTFDVKAKSVPNAQMTAEISVDCRLRHLSVRNPSGGSVTTVTVQDGSGNLLYFATLGSGGIFEVEKGKPGQLVAGGISWQASGAGLIGDITAEPNQPA